MKKALFLMAALLLVAAPAFATVVGSSHDFSSAGPGVKTNTTQVCVFCHTPHNAYVNNTSPMRTTNPFPLWNHQAASQASYGFYDSQTMNASDLAVAAFGADFTTGTPVSSQLCMSCHDGTVSIATLYKLPSDVTALTVTAGGNVAANGMIKNAPNIGNDLRNDHPINFTYDTALATADGGLVTPTNASQVGTANLPLFANKMQCGTCHNAHDNTNDPFLRASNAASALCTQCHNK